MPPTLTRRRRSSATTLSDGTSASSVVSSVQAHRHAADDRICNASMPKKTLWKERQRKQLFRLGEALSSGPSRASK